MCNSLSLSTVVNCMVSYFFALPQHASQYTLPEKTKIHWLHYDNTDSSLDTAKIQIVQLVGNQDSRGQEERRMSELFIRNTTQNLAVAVNKLP